MEIIGTFYYPKSSKTQSAKLYFGKSSIKVFANDGSTLVSEDINQIKKNLQIFNTQSEINFTNGACFIASDRNIKIPIESNVSFFNRLLIKNKKIFVTVFLITPFSLWIALSLVLPIISDSIVKRIPDSSKSYISEKIFEEFSENYYVKSSLTQAQKTNIINYFNNSLDRLGLDKNKYKLLFFKAEEIGVNAFAFPDGTIVLTDSMVLLLEDNPKALLSILLHEVGHVENNHGLKLMVESIGYGIVISYLIGDIQGFTEILSTSGIFLMQASFSREHETEADVFSLESLNKLGISKDNFMHAFEKISNQNNAEDFEKYLKYISTHPITEDRIKLAKEYEN